jgi:hypothetical protein
MRATPNKTSILSEIHASYTPGKELSPHIRSIIIGLSLADKNATDISRSLQIPRTTVQRTIDLYTSRDANKSIRRSGRPKLYNGRDERRILRLVRQNPKIRWRDVMHKLDLGISKRSFQRLLQKHGIRK